MSCIDNAGFLLIDEASLLKQNNTNTGIRKKSPLLIGRATCISLVFDRVAEFFGEGADVPIVLHSFSVQTIDFDGSEG